MVKNMARLDDDFGRKNSSVAETLWMSNYTRAGSYAAQLSTVARLCSNFRFIIHIDVYLYHVLLIYRTAGTMTSR